MIHFNNLFSSFSIFFFFFLLHPLLLNAACLIQDSCKEISTSDSNVVYDFCVTTLKSDPRSATATTVAHLGAISFQLGVTKTKSISSKIASISKDPKLDPSVTDALKACSEAYLDAQRALQDGLKAFENGDYSTANVRANSALVVPDACEHGFKVSPLTKENSDFFQISAISLGFTDLLHKS